MFQFETRETSLKSFTEEPVMSNSAPHVLKQIEQGYELLLSLLGDLRLQLDLCGVPSRECQRNGPLPEWHDLREAYSDEEFALWILPALSDFYSISESVYVALKQLHDQDDELFHPGRIAVWPWGIRFSADPHDVKKSLEEFIWNQVLDYEEALAGKNCEAEFFAKYSELEAEANRYLAQLREYVTFAPKPVQGQSNREAPLEKAILAILPDDGIRRALGPIAIQAKLVEAGTVKSNDSVRRALTRMVKKGLAKRQKRGKYIRTQRGKEKWLSGAK